MSNTNSQISDVSVEAELTFEALLYDQPQIPSLIYTTDDVNLLFQYFADIVSGPNAVEEFFRIAEELSDPTVNIALIPGASYAVNVLLKYEGENTDVPSAFTDLIKETIDQVFANYMRWAVYLDEIRNPAYLFLAAKDKNIELRKRPNVISPNGDSNRGEYHDTRLKFLENLFLHLQHPVVDPSEIKGFVNLFEYCLSFEHMPEVVSYFRMIDVMADPTRCPDIAAVLKIANGLAAHTLRNLGAKILRTSTINNPDSFDWKAPDITLAERNHRLNMLELCEIFAVDLPVNVQPIRSLKN